MSFQEAIASDVQNLAVGNVVTLFELDLTQIGGTDILYFTESINNDYTPVVWNAREYIPIHMQSEGWQVTGTEQLPRPKIIVSNVLLTFASYINSFDSLVGAKLTRRRTLEKYLDDKPTANPYAEFAPDIYKILSMPQRTKSAVEFELTPYIDFEGIKIPKRQILRDFCRQTYRRWDATLNKFIYTTATCPYTGTYCFTRLGAYTTDQSQDNCGKELSDCEMRYAANRVSGLVYIRAIEPTGGAEGCYWLDIATTPNTWYKKVDGVFVTLKPEPLPTWAFPSVSRFRI